MDMDIVDLQVKGHHIKAEFTQGAENPARVGVVFMGGFLADALDPHGKSEVIKSVSCARGFAFARFNYVAHGVRPETRSDGKLSDIAFRRMTDEACAAALATNMPNIVLAANEIGAGLMPYAAMKIHERSNARVKGMFGFAAVTPDVMYQGLVQQLGATGLAFLKGGHGAAVRIGSVSEDFPLSTEQFNDIDAHRYRHKEPRELPYQGYLTLVGGQDDPLGSSRFTNRIIRALRTKNAQSIVLKGMDHELDRDVVVTHFEQFLSSLRL